MPEMASKWIKSSNVAKHVAFSTPLLRRFVIASNGVYLLRFMAATVRLRVTSPLVSFQRVDVTLNTIQNIYAAFGIASFTTHTVVSARNANPKSSQKQSQTPQKKLEQ